MSRASRAVGPVLRTLDMGCRTGLSRRRMNDPEVTMLDALDRFDQVRAMVWRLINPEA